MLEKPKEIILIVNFKGQYSRIIARRVRELFVYCEIVGFEDAFNAIKTKKPKGIIFSGGPDSVFLKDSPKINKEIFSFNIPILGICYGAQLIVKEMGGLVEPAKTREFGTVKTEFKTSSLLFSGLKVSFNTLMSHTDEIVKLPENFKVTAKSKTTKIAAFEDSEKKIYATQFHPEVLDTEFGEEIFKNFLFKVCRCEQNWHMEDFIKNTVKEVKKKVGDKKVLLALSGGVDSCVLAALLQKAIKKQLTAVFVDHGFLRENEAKEINSYFKEWEMNFVFVDASEIFLEKIKGVKEPEEKRKIIGKTFIEVFEKEAKKIKDVEFLAQGTIYPDIIESGENNKKSTIKSHHNVGGLPEKIKFKEILEPFRFLFKDEVREIGKKLNLPERIVNRQPFPGPGLAIRIIGEITKEKLEILKKADHIFRKEVEKLKEKPSQFFAVLLNTKSVGVMGDCRSYCYNLALRAVETKDFMTARVFAMPIEKLEQISKKIVNNVAGINRVLYDVTTKPPATIEFEWFIFEGLQCF